MCFIIKNMRNRWINFQPPIQGTRRLNIKLLPTNSGMRQLYWKFWQLILNFFIFLMHLFSDKNIKNVHFPSFFIDLIENPIISNSQTMYNDFEFH
jgi:hypothetical protein